MSSRNLNLDNIPLDVLSLIFRRLSPKDVFLLSQVCRRFSEYSNRSELWIMLMGEHYPTYQLTETPRKQYQALAHNHISRYYVNSMAPFEYDDVAYLGNLPLEEEFDVREIEVIGLPPPDETDLWVVCAYSQLKSFTSSEEDVIYTAYNTYREAVDVVVDMYSDFLHLVESHLEESGQFASLSLDETATDLGLPIPFTKERLSQWLMAEGSQLSCRVGEVYLGADISLVSFMRSGPQVF
jgi:hypothetical protein